MRSQISFPPGDYVSPGFAQIQPDGAFPDLVRIAPEELPGDDPLRSLPHHCYGDRQWSGAECLSRDEAHLLYNTALHYQGRRSLVVGGGSGWAVAHLALAGMRVDVVDPRLQNPGYAEEIRHALQRLGVLEQVQFVTGNGAGNGENPDVIAQIQSLAKAQQRRWTVLFINSQSEAPGTLQAAIAAEQWAEVDALILFHGVRSPEVAQGVNYLRQRGWQTMIYQTRQMMAAAWRGAIVPVPHQPDPSVQWQLPSHLVYYPVSLSAPTTPPPEPPPLRSHRQAHMLLQAAMEQFNQGDPTAALYLTDQAVAMGATIPELNYLRSVCLVQLGRSPEALAAAQAELALNPHHHEAQKWVHKLTQPQEVAATPTTLSAETQEALQQAIPDYRYRGFPLSVRWLDLALVPLLLWELKPRSLLLLDTANPGLGLWLADYLEIFGIDGQVYAFPPTHHALPSHPRLLPLEGSPTALSEHLSTEFLTTLPRPLLAQIPDGLDLASVLAFFHPHLQAGDRLLFGSPTADLNALIAAYPGHYLTDPTGRDRLGMGQPNGLQKVTPPLAVAPAPAAPLSVAETVVERLLNAVETLAIPETSPMLSQAIDQVQLREWLEQGQDAFVERNFQGAIATFSRLLEMHPTSAIAHHYLSAAYWQLGNVQTSLRYHMGEHRLFPVLDDAGLALLEQLRPYTRLSAAQWQRLWELARKTAWDDGLGDWSVAGNLDWGAITLLAMVLHQDSLRPRTLYLPEEAIALLNQALADNPADTSLPKPLIAIWQTHSLHARTASLATYTPGSPHFALVHLQPPTLPVGDRLIRYFDPALSAGGSLYLCTPTGAIAQTLALQNAHLFWRSVDARAIWCRQSWAIAADSNHWQTLWHLAQLATRLGDTTLAERATAAVMKLIPHLVEVESLPVDSGGDRLPEPSQDSEPFTTAPTTEEDASSDWRADTPPAPVEPEDAIAQEALEVLEQAGVYSLEHLDELIRQCQADSEAFLEIGQLRRVRQQLAHHWLSLLSDELEQAYTSHLGQVQWMLMGSGIKDEPLTEAEQRFRQDTQAFLTEGLAAPGAVQHFLAAMLYNAPDQIAVDLNLEAIPPWFRRDYLAFMWMPPCLFQEAGAIAHYGNYMGRWVNYLYDQLQAEPEATIWQEAAIAFQEFADLTLLYFTDQALADLAEKRAIILNVALQAEGHPLAEEFPERSPDRSQLRLGILFPMNPADPKHFLVSPLYRHLARSQFEVMLFALPFDRDSLEGWVTEPDTAILLPGTLAEQVEVLRAANLDLLVFAADLFAGSGELAAIALHRIARRQIAAPFSPVYPSFSTLDARLMGTLPEASATEDAKTSNSTWLTLPGTGYCSQVTDLDFLITQSTLDRDSLNIPADRILYIAGNSLWNNLPEQEYLWATILAEVPQSRLILLPDRSRSRQFCPPLSWQKHLATMLAEQGAKESQLLLFPEPLSLADWFTLLILGDVYLSAHPACELPELAIALQKGIPVVARHSPALRSPSFFSELHLEDLLSETEADYRERAIALGTNPDLRHQMRDRITQATVQNPLCFDSVAYGKELGDRLQAFWQEYPH
mgnify:CR=1 FL=1